MAISFVSPSYRAASSDLTIAISPLGLVELADEEFEVHGPRLNRRRCGVCFGPMTDEEIRRACLITGGRTEEEIMQEIASTGDRESICGKCGGY